MQALKVIARLLDYPQPELLAHTAELAEALGADAFLPEPRRQELLAFIEQLSQRDLFEVQEDYVSTFDRGRAMSLLLFEHVHGESRDRGQAMVDLMNVYRENGFELDARELPDYLPLFLEYLSERPASEAHDWLSEVEHILARLAERLNQRENTYALLFEALLAFTENEVDRDAIRKELQGEKRDDTPAAMDKVWEEEAVRFGGDGQVSGGCPTTMKPSPAQDRSADFPLQFMPDPKAAAGAGQARV
ncbi:MAG: nitrate reductase molybdenum cofactor assembly chaperone [Gammaproteobacteria bacterium]|nr:nitrate reductase molybdenum cofactor assembly chaperone [Gammaproteobacteria bacterium]